ncbi:MAG: site-specific integrase [Planctomycetes bacterium]|nr:site-specific integrase [Planctomycetota bacterium]
MGEIVVKVVEFRDRRYYQHQWRDPDTGRKKTKSTGIERTGRASDRKKAEKAAGKFEAALREGRHSEPSRVTWVEFRERYEDEVLAGLAEKTDHRVRGIFNSLEQILHPERLRDVTTDRLSHYQRVLRDRGASESTIGCHLSHLKAALRWAGRIGLLPKVPVIQKPRRAKSADVMKGRPVTGEEFERLLEKVEAGLLKAVLRTGHPKRKTKRRIGEEALHRRREQQKTRVAIIAPSWRHYLRGLWLSGLRLAESLESSWDDGAKLCVDLSDKYPMLKIPAELEKGHKDRLLPLAPEFAEFLLETPEHERTGFVFNPLPFRGEGRVTADRAMKVISTIGQCAGVKVATDQRTGTIKYASAHDLRRSFGERWAARIMPPDLMLLMRHESIETTLRFYVGRNAQRTAKTLWEAHKKAQSGNTSGNSAQISPDSAAEQIDVTPSCARHF